MTIVGYDVDRRTIDPGVHVVLDEQPGAVSSRLDPARVFFQQGDHRIVAFDRDLRPIGPPIDTADVSIGAISAAPDRPLLVVSNFDGVMAVFDTDTGREVGRIDGPTNAVAIPGGRIVGVSPTGELTVYDADTLEVVQTLPGSRGFVVQMDASSDGSVLLARSGDRTASLYDLASGIRLGDPIAVPTGDINSAQLRFDGRKLAIGGGRSRDPAVGPRPRPVGGRGLPHRRTQPDPPGVDGLSRRPRWLSGDLSGASGALTRFGPDPGCTCNQDPDQNVEARRVRRW